MSKTKKEVIEQYFEAFYNVNNADKARALASELVAEDFKDHSPAFGATPDKKGIVNTIGLINTWFEQQYKVDLLIQENNLYTGIWKSQVRHVGEFLGVPPTSKIFTVSGITIYRIENNKITEHWEQFDIPVILQNLGILK